MKRVFNHEKLQVYQDSIHFVVWASELLERIPKGLSVSDQLNRASASIPLNIAEGNGKFTAPDRCRYFDNARGSAFECAACLDVLVARKVLVAPDVTPGKETLHGIVSMLVGLIRSNSSDRLHEDQVEYQVGNHETNDTTDVNHRSAENPTRSYFDHEKLKVYQAALEFITLGNGFLERYQHSRTISERLDRASTSIPLNIAEGNGKFTAADRCRFFDQAHGAALSCAACLDLVAAKDKSESVQISDGKALLQQIVAMLVGLIKSNSSDRLHEQAAGYRNGGDLSTYDGRTD